MQEHELRNLTNEELLRYVDRSNPEVKELAQRLKTVLDAREAMYTKLNEVRGFV